MAMFVKLNLYNSEVAYESDVPNSARYFILDYKLFGLISTNPKSPDRTTRLYHNLFISKKM